MSEETMVTAPADPSAPASGAANTAASGAGGRKKAPVKAASTARRGRQRPAAAVSTSSFGTAALASESRSQNPSSDDPFQSGQRIWPD